MTIAAEYAPSVAVGNGVTTVFPFDFPIWQETDLKVALTDPSGIEVPMVLHTDYTVTINGRSGGQVTMLVPPPNAYVHRIERDMSLTQPASIRNQNTFYPTAVEDALDRACMVDQQQQTQLDDQAGAIETLQNQQTGAATVTALLTGSISGTTLTITSITGIVTAGMAIAYQGSPAALAIQSLGTSTGGVGTVILNQSVGAVASQKMTASGAGALVLLGIINALASTSQGLGDALLSVLQPWTGAVARNQGDRNADFKSVFDWFTPAQIADVRAGTMTKDVTAAIQAALNYSATYNVGILFPSGVYGISTTLNYRTGTCIVGESSISTIIRMMALPSGSKPTYTGGTSYPPTLNYFPILWNASPVQWWSIKNICLDGNNLNVYGLRLQENFYGDIEDLVIQNCNQYAYINIRGQNIMHRGLRLYHNQAGMLTLDNTQMEFVCCGFEQTGTATGGYCVEVRTPVSTKCGVAFRSCWFEDGTGNYAVTTAVLAVSGRNPIVEDAFINMSGGTPLIIKLIGAGDARTLDGISNANASGAISGRFNFNVVSGAAGITTSTDSVYNLFDGLYPNTGITDNGVGNTFDQGPNLSTVVRHVMGRFQVRFGLSGGAVPLGASAYVLDADPNGGNPILRLLGNSNNSLDLNSGNLRLKANLGLELTPGQGGNGDVFCNTTSGGFYVPRLTTTQKNAVSWANGAIVYDSTLAKFQGYAGGVWTNLN